MHLMAQGVLHDLFRILQGTFAIQNTYLCVINAVYLCLLHALITLLVHLFK